MRKAEIEKAIEAGTVLALREGRWERCIPVIVESPITDGNRSGWKAKHAKTGDYIPVFREIRHIYKHTLAIPSNLFVGPYDEVMAEAQRIKDEQEKYRTEQEDRRRKAQADAEVLAERVRAAFPDCRVTTSLTVYNTPVVSLTPKGN